MLIVYTTMPSARTCNDPAAEGASITVDGNCWTHTHKDMWNINDLSYIQPYMPSAIKNYAKMDPHHLVVTALNGGECLCGSAVQPLGARRRLNQLQTHMFFCATEIDFDVSQFDQPNIPGLYNYPEVRRLRVISKFCLLCSLLTLCAQCFTFHIGGCWIHRHALLAGYSFSSRR